MAVLRDLPNELMISILCMVERKSLVRLSRTSRWSHKVVECYLAHPVVQKWLKVVRFVEKGLSSGPRYSGRDSMIRALIDRMNGHRWRYPLQSRTVGYEQIIDLTFNQKKGVHIPWAWDMVWQKFRDFPDFHNILLKKDGDLIRAIRVTGKGIRKVTLTTGSSGFQFDSTFYKSYHVGVNSVHLELYNYFPMICLQWYRHILLCVDADEVFEVQGLYGFLDNVERRKLGQAKYINLEWSPDKIQFRDGVCHINRVNWDVYEWEEPI